MLKIILRNRLLILHLIQKINHQKNNTKIDKNFVENQIVLRQEYKTKKNFSKDDEIRLKCNELGVSIEDKP